MNFKLSTKIWTGYLLLIALSLALTVVSYKGLQVISSVIQMNHLYEVFLRREIDHLNWANQLRQQIRSESMIKVQRDPTKCAFGRWFYGEDRQKMSDLFPELGELLDKIEGPHNMLHRTADAINSYAEEGRYHLALEIYEEQSEVALKEIQMILSEARDILESKISEYGENASAIVAKIIITLLVGGFIVLLAGFLLAFLMVTMTTKPINHAIKFLKEGASNISNYAHQLTKQSERLSESSRHQASAIQETASSVDEIHSMVDRNAESTESSKKVSSQSSQSADVGKKYINEMVSSIDEISSSNQNIAEQVKKSNEEFSKIVDVISGISEKTKVINEIVFQTKLLSFNASVEAARAGEAGKGFAVVAEEVGNLANLSGKAAIEISELLENSTKHVSEIVEKSKTSIEKLVMLGQEKVLHGTQITKQCEEALNDILTSVKTVDGMIDEIATASREQSLGVQEVTKAMQSLDQVTLENNQVAQDVAEMAGNLSIRASELDTTVQQLTVVISGKNTSPQENNEKNTKVKEDPSSFHEKKLDFHKKAS